MKFTKLLSQNANKPGAIIIEGHVQGLSNVRSLGQAGIPVYVVDKTTCVARHSKYCLKFFKCPDFQTDAFAEFLLSLAQEHNLSGWVLLPSNDHAVYTISRHKEQLSEFYRVISPDLAITEQVYHKQKLLSLATQLGLPIPLTQYFSSASDIPIPGLQFPVLTKGRNGLSFYKALGRKAFLASNREELQKQLAEIERHYPIEGTFTQELIPFNGHNKTISFTAFCVDGQIKTFWMGVKLREHPIRFGTATLAKSVYKQECLNQSIPLLKVLKYTGVCEVEYLLDPRDGKYKLIEINARTWLWVGLARACGVDYAKIIYDFVNGNPINYPATYKTGKYWVNPLTDLVFSVKAMLLFRLNIGIYLKTLFVKKENALFAKGDKKPGFFYFLNMFSYLNLR